MATPRVPVALLATLALLGMTLGGAQAASKSKPKSKARPFLCAGNAVCSQAIGLGVSIPAGDGPGIAEFNPGTHIAIYAKGKGAAHRLRLDVGPLGTAKSTPTAARTALLRYLHTLRTSRSVGRITYSGAPGYVAHAVHVPIFGVSTVMVLDYKGRLYQAIAPGKTLSTDQTYMLKGLLFLPLSGTFPKS